MSKDEKFTLMFTVDGVAYPLVLDDFDGNETGVLKRIGHVRGLSEIVDAIDCEDLEVIAVLAGIAMKRTGISADYDKLLKLKLGEIKIDIPDKGNEKKDPLAKAGNSTKTPAKTGSQS